jgi:hypothetical protein
MPNRVLLKNFDVQFRKANALLDRLDARVASESSSPKVWTKEQAADLMLVDDVFTILLNAVSELAARVRDD